MNFAAPFYGEIAKLQKCELGLTREVVNFMLHAVPRFLKKMADSFFPTTTHDHER
jgi:hypothetical protein